MLQEYEDPQNLNKADNYLLKGIYDHDPDAQDYQLDELQLLEASKNKKSKSAIWRMTNKAINILP